MAAIGEIYFDKSTINVWFSVYTKQCIWMCNGPYLGPYTTALSNRKL